MLKAVQLVMSVLDNLLALLLDNLVITELEEAG